jgi:hypothetical protein
MGSGASGHQAAKMPPNPPARKPRFEEADHGVLSVPSANSHTKIFEADMLKPGSAEDIKTLPAAQVELKRYVELIPSFEEGLLRTAQMQIARARKILKHSAIPMYTLDELDKLLHAADELVEEVNPLLEADPIAGADDPENQKRLLQQLLDKQDAKVRSKEYVAAGELHEGILRMSTKKGGDDEHIRLNRTQGMLKQLAKNQKLAEKKLATIAKSIKTERKEIVFGKIKRTHGDPRIDDTMFESAHILAENIRELKQRRRPLLSYLTRFRERKIMNDKSAPPLYQSKAGRFRTMPLNIDKRHGPI